MFSVSPYYFLIIVCISLAIFHALQQNKALINYLFAIFCVSLCMLGLKQISAPSLGAYQYLIGLATCATCNVSWLISRTLFRQTKPITRRHILLACFIALLIMLNQAWHYMINAFGEPLVSSAFMWRLKEGLGEITVLLSSSILVLSFYEALRGYNSKTAYLKKQSIIFASAFCVAVVNASILPKFLFSPEQIEAMSGIITVSSALLVVGAMQVLIIMQAREQKNELNEVKASNKEHEHSVAPQLIADINQLMHKQQLYLQANIKIADIAQALGEPEYKISRAVRYHFRSANFNSFVNQYRIKHAKMLLRSEHSKDWNILCIALESGFSSLATFNRVFKNMLGQLPNEYRKDNEDGALNMKAASVG